MSNHKVHLIRQSLHLDLLLLRPVKSLQGVRVEDAVLEADQRTGVPDQILNLVRKSGNSWVFGQVNGL